MNAPLKTFKNRLKVLAKLAFLVIPVIFLFLINEKLTSDYPNNQNINFTDKEQAWLDTHPEVIVGFVSDLPPTLMVDENGEYQGIVPEYFALLSQYTGINFHIKLSSTWEKMISEAVDKKTDLIAMLIPSKSFAIDFDFPPPYFKVHFYIFGAGNLELQEYKLNDLVGKKIGFLQSARIYKKFIKNHQELDFIPFELSGNLVSALISGKVDFIIHVSTLEYWRQKNNILTFKIVGSVPGLTSNTTAGVRKDWPELTSIINKFALITQPQQKNIIDKWLEYSSYGITHNNTVQLTIEEELWIKKHPVIRVGFSASSAPLEFLGPNEQPQGLSIQYLQILEKSLGLHFEFIKNNSQPEFLKKLGESQIDVLSSITTDITEHNLYNLTSPYVSLSKGVFSTEYKAHINGVDELKGKRVVVVEGSVIQKWLKKNHPRIILDSAPDVKTALKIIDQGKAFAFIENHLTANYYIARSGLSQIRMIGEIAHQHNLAIAIRKDWAILQSILQKGIDVISQSQHNGIYADWVSIKYNKAMDLTLLWQVLAIGSLIILLIILWNRRLTKEINHRIKVESALVQAQKEADRAYAEKTETLTQMSHEIRTSLNVVIGAEHIIRQTELSTQQRECVNNMASSSKSLLKIINDLLDYSKIEAGMLALETTRLNISEILHTELSNLKVQVKEKDLTFKLIINPDIPSALEGDLHKLEQILRNFGSNAIKFTEKGYISLSVDILESKADTVSLCFALEDTGIGMTPEQQEKLFHPFSQSESSITRKYGGTGLGLVISQQLAGLMGGEIKVQSIKGEGSKFSLHVTFQVAKQQRKQVRAVPTKQPKLCTKVPGLIGVNILLVEDDVLNQWVARRIILALGANVEIAENGKKALEVLENKLFDLVLLDIHMPKMDGYETIHKIRQQGKFSDLPVIAMTADSLSREDCKYFTKGMNDYLTKPIDPILLKELLLKWAGKERVEGGGQFYR